MAPPADDQNGRLDPGILEYVTVYSHEPATATNGTARALVTNAGQLRTVLQNAGVTVRPGGATYTSVLDFYFQSGISSEDFARIEDQIRNPIIDGLVNVNTASAAVLACVFAGAGVDTNIVSTLVAYRQAQTGPLTSMSWVKDVLDLPTVRLAGRYLTGKTYQYSADIAAVGHYGRGYRRVKYIFDTSDGAPKVLYRQELTHMGWALGKQARDTLLLAKAIP